MSLKIIFTWWNKQTFGTFLKTLFFGKFVGSDDYGNKYYKSKKDERWVVYADNIEATKITSDWFLWIHHTIDKIPESFNLILSMAFNPPATIAGTGGGILLTMPSHIFIMYMGQEKLKVVHMLL